MADTLTVYASIGNSDDKLPQAEWAQFHELFDAVVRRAATRVYGAWVSPSASPWQNACIAFEIAPDTAAKLKQVLGEVAAEFSQDSIAWAVASTEFIGPGQSTGEVAGILSAAVAYPEDSAPAETRAG